MSQTEHLKSMLSDFGRKIEVLKSLNKTANSKMDGQDLNQINKISAELNSAIESATKGDAESLNKFVSTYASINK